MHKKDVMNNNDASGLNSDNTVVVGMKIQIPLNVPQDTLRGKPES